MDFVVKNSSIQTITYNSNATSLEVSLGIFIAILFGSLAGIFLILSGCVIGHKCYMKYLKKPWCEKDSQTIWFIEETESSVKDKIKCPKFYDYESEGSDREEINDLKQNLEFSDGKCGKSETTSVKKGKKTVKFFDANFLHNSFDWSQKSSEFCQQNSSKNIILDDYERYYSITQF